MIRGLLILFLYLTSLENFYDIIISNFKININLFFFTNLFLLIKLVNLDYFLFYSVNLNNYLINFINFSYNIFILFLIIYIFIALLVSIELVFNFKSSFRCF